MIFFFSAIESISGCLNYINISKGILACLIQVWRKRLPVNFLLDLLFIESDSFAAVCYTGDGPGVLAFFLGGGF